jgi:hypothetical protein
LTAEARAELRSVPAITTLQCTFSADPLFLFLVRSLTFR